MSRLLLGVACAVLCLAGASGHATAQTPALSDDATLSALTLSGVRLTPRFTGGTTSYTASVGYTVTRTTVAATPSNDSATIEYLDGNGSLLGSGGSIDVDLPVGETVIAVRVTAQDGVGVETYTVTVTRAAEDLSLTPPASDPVAPFASRATYTITFRGAWTSSVTPGGRPGGVYFSRLIGAVHSDAVTFLESGATASSGVESMAEVGGTSTLRREVNAARNASPPTALSVIEDPTGSISPTAVRILGDRTLTTEFPRVTLTTMIAPSHDWFVGVSGQVLLDASGRWMRSLGVDLFPWDAGTEEGDDFSLSPSVDTTPRGVITSIRGTGRFTTERIASLAFRLQSVRTERRLRENAPAGVDVGPAVAAVASAGEVTYTLGGPDAASFELVRSTGQLRTRPGATYDREAKPTYTVTVTATDADGPVVTTVEIHVEESGEAPGEPCLSGAVSVGFSLLIAGGGSLERLLECAEDRHLSALYATDSGTWVTHVSGAPALVNRNFADLFADGIAPGAPLLARSEGPASGDPAPPREPEGGAECLAGDVVPGFTLVAAGGGSLDELVSCARERGISVLYALHGGSWVSHVVGAPELVNRAFSVLFADGIAPGTPLVATSGRRG